MSRKEDVPTLDWHSVLGPGMDTFTAEELHALESSLTRHPDRCVRLSTEANLPFATTPVPWSSLGRFVSEDVLPAAFLEYAAGNYYVQDAGSLLALELCDLSGGESVLDACAAPGGKSTGILESLRRRGQGGFLIANEVIAGRVPQLSLACQRTGAANYLVTHREIDRLAPTFTNAFDCVLVDAPCSGQSMVMRGKQSWSSFTSPQIEHNANRQVKILDHASELVRPGGRLVYSTCTFAFQENEGALMRFLDQHPDWQCQPLPSLETWESTILPSTYRLWPHRDRCAGAFAAALVRESDDETQAETRSAQEGTNARLAKSRNKRQTKSKWTELALSAFDGALPFFECLDPKASVWQFEHASGDKVLVTTSAPQAWLEQAYAFPALARSKGKRWEPAFEAAKYGAFSQVYSSLRARHAVDLTRIGAKSYVAGEAIPLNVTNCETIPSETACKEVKGWVVMTWNGRALGWAKVSGSVAKNHFPKPLRQAAQTLR